MEPTALRKDLDALWKVALRSVEPVSLVRSYLESHPEFAACDGRLAVVAFGKAAARMIGGAYEALGERVARGIAVGPFVERIHAPAVVEYHDGGHPYPTDDGRVGACRVRDLALSLNPGDRLLCLFSGGGSAYLTLPPPGVPVEDLRRVTELLHHAGATIADLNTVRKHLDRLKGGFLAAAAGAASVSGLVISDVIGDTVDVIASGPISPDPTTFEDAFEVIDRYGVRDTLPASVRRYLERGVAGDVPETPSRETWSGPIPQIELLANNRTALDAVLNEAQLRGYVTRVHDDGLIGEARDAGRRFGESLCKVRADGDSPVCVVAGGETTVTVQGTGSGGRNQELALGAALAIDGVDGVCAGSFATDGVDGPTPAAGAVVTGTTVARAHQLGLDPLQSLANNDSHSLFVALDDAIQTGLTGTNVCDLQIGLVG